MEMQKKKKMIIASILIILLILVFMLFAIIFITNNSNNNQNENIELKYENLNTIKEVVLYYKCIYISEVISSDSNYNIDVNLEFCKPLYESDDISNESFYNSIIKDIARVSKYKNFRLLDSKNDIKIEVECRNYKVYNVIINGISDYFIYMDSQLSLKKYKEIPITEFSVESQVLSDAISANWSKDVLFGTRDSIYNQYNIYFEEGIKVRIVDSKIYNIIFTEKYLGTIVNGINLQTSQSNIKYIFGNPTFEDKKLQIIGYKGKDFYIFFKEGEISVYKNQRGETEEFLRLTENFLNDKIDFLEMMNELTYIWKDYSKYEYSAEKVYISYPNKGVEIKINYDNTTGIIIYNNFNAELSNINKFLENTEFMGYLQLDGVFEAEKRRIEDDIEQKELINNYKEENISNGYVSSIYDIYPTIEEEKYITKLKFISKSNDRPNRELNDTINTFLWGNDVTLIFSKMYKGIYVYDLNSGIVKEILTGTSEYELKSYENGILKFDNTELQIQF